MTSHNTKTIIESEAFRAINLLIAQQVERLRSLQMVIIDQAKCLGVTREQGIKPRISTHAYEEDAGRGTPLLFNMVDLGEIEFNITEARKTESMIASLVRFKLRLLNDCDFTHGDNSEQIAVFGPATS